MSTDKKSYRSSRGKRRERLKNITLLPSDKESHTSPHGEAGMIPLDIRQVTTDDFSSDDTRESAADKDKNYQVIDDETVNKLNELFIATADAMDSVGEHNSASFIDFLIKKFASSKNLDYSAKFNDLLIKINESDLVDINKILIYIVKQYTRNISTGVLSGKNIDVSKEDAYNKSVNMFESIMRG